MRAVDALFTVSLLATVGGCSHTLEGATPGVSGVEPSLVCVEQLTTVVTITGDDLSPLPIESATDHPQLLLPSIELRRTQDLAGIAVSEPAVRIPDEPANPAASRVRWTSATAMQFDVFPELGLLPGIYEITVTNGNGRAITRSGALAGVSKPTITTVVPDLVCEDQAERRITVNGSSFIKLGTTLPTVTLGTMTYTASAAEACTPIMGSPIAAELCTSLVVTIPQASVPDGAYDVTVTNPDPAGCSSSDTTTVQIAFVPPPVITSLAPASLCGTQGDHTMTINGTGFIQIGTTLPSVRIGTANLAATTASGCTPIDGTITGAKRCTSLTVTIPQGAIAQGASPVTVTNPDPAGCASTQSIDLSLLPGPLAVFVDPGTVWNGVNTPVTVYTTGVTTPLVRVSIVLTGTTNAPTMLAFTPATNHPERPNAIVPAATPPGTYDVIVEDSSSCPTRLTAGLRITNTTTLQLTGILPSFGWTNEVTSVAITASTTSPSTGFGSLPSVYLTNNALTTPIVLGSVARISATALTADVPSGIAPAIYDVVVVNQDGTVGVLPAAFTVTANPPPHVTSISPPQVANTSTTQAFTINGRNFRTTTPPLPGVVLRCIGPNAVAFAPQTATVIAATATTIQARFDATLHPQGANCVVVVTNSDDGSRTEFSSLVVITPQQNLTGFRPGPMMATARRGHGAVSGAASQQARFVYAIAGDDGTAAVSSVEMLPVDIFGQPGVGFVTQRNALTTARTGIGAVAITSPVTVARPAASTVIYAIGGTSAMGAATSALASIERAAILDQRFHPENLDIDLLLSTTDGLGGGIYYYRVAAVMPSTDPFNPGGETLPSGPFGLNLPTLSGRQLRVTLSWDPVPGASGYRIYRSVANGAAGSEALIADTSATLPPTVTCATATLCTDIGAVPDAARTPLPLGSTGTWTTLATTMSIPRWAPGVTFALDPLDPTRAHVYIFGGRNATGVLTSYELLTLQLDASGAQTAVGVTTGTVALAAGRYRLGAWVATPADSARLGGSTYVWAGGGANATNGMVTTFEGGRVTPGGQLAGFGSAGAMNPAAAGYGAFGAGDYLYAFGGANGMPAVSNMSAEHTLTPPALQNFQGFTPGLQIPRVDVAAAEQSGYFYVLGGTTTGGVVTPTIEFVLY
jgi:hypothetical protein